MKKYNQKLISELSKGEIACGYTQGVDKLEDLWGVLKEAAPNSKYSPCGTSYLYGADPFGKWQAFPATDLPVIPLSQFLLPEFQEGDEVEVSESGRTWQPMKFLHESKSGVFFAVSGNGQYASGWRYCRPLSPKPEVILTMQELTARLLAIEEQIKIKK